MLAIGKKLVAIIFLSLVLSTLIQAQRLDLKKISLFNEFRYKLFEISHDGTWFILLGNNQLHTSPDNGQSWDEVKKGNLGSFVMAIKTFI